MASIKIFAVLMLTSIISTVLARPGHGSYLGGHTIPVAYTSYSYPSYGYGYGHGLYSSLHYPLYGYGHGGYGYGGHGYGGWLGDWW